MLVNFESLNIRRDFYWRCNGAGRNLMSSALSCPEILACNLVNSDSIEKLVLLVGADYISVK